MNKQDVNVVAFSSVPGGGKSRLLFELPGLLKRHHDIRALYYVTLNHPTRLGNYNNLDKYAHTAEKYIAMRIIFQAVQCQRLADIGMALDFKQWLDEVDSLGLKSITSIKEAITLIGGDPNEKCMLAVDAVNKLQQDIKDTGAVFPDSPHRAMKKLGIMLGQVVLNSQIFSYMAGTLIRPSLDGCLTQMVYVYLIYLPALSYDDQAAILDECADLRGWRCEREGKRLLLELGGIPRLLQGFIEAATSQLGGIKLSGVNWADVKSYLEKHQLRSYNWTGDDVRISQRLVDNVLMRVPVDPNNKVLEDIPSPTYDYLQATCRITLQPACMMRNNFTVQMPLLVFRNLVKKVMDSSYPSNKRYINLNNLLDTKPRDWGSFEEFGIQHAAVMNQFFAETRPHFFPLHERYVQACEGAPETWIKLLKKRPGVISPLRQSPTTTKLEDPKTLVNHGFIDGNCYLSAPQAPFSDVFYACETKNSIFEEKARLFLVIEKHHFGHQSQFNFEACTAEHEKNMRLWEQTKSVDQKERYSLITVVITTCQLAPPQAHSYHKGLLVIDKSRFREFYGVLEPLVPLELAHRLDINVADIQDLKQVFPDSVAEGIMSHRENGGFRNESEFDEWLEANGVTEKFKNGVARPIDF